MTQSEIDFVTFKKILNKNNILLFDCHQRIAHFRYNQIVKTKYLHQKGGGNLKNSKILLKKIRDKKYNLLNNFVNSLLSNNLNKINYIIDYTNNNNNNYIII